MKNKTLAIILLLCTALVPTGFAGASPRNRSNYSNIKLVKIDPKSENYAMGTLKMLSVCISKWPESVPKVVADRLR